MTAIAAATHEFVSAEVGSYSGGVVVFSAL